MIKKRLVCHFPGFEKVSPEQHYQRFCAQFSKCKTTWDVAGEIDGFQLNDNHTAQWRIKAEVDQHPVECDYNLFNWHMLMAAYHERSLISRFCYGMLRYIKLFFSATPISYFKTNWRYGLFFLYPALLLIGLTLISYYASRFAPQLLGFDASLQAQIGIFAVLLLALLKFIAEPWHLFLMLDDWAFAYDMMHSKNQDFEAKTADFALQLEKIINQSDADEIIISGHSFGAIFAIYSLAKMIGEGGEPAKPIIIITAASSILKIAFAKPAHWLRDALNTVLSSQKIHWAEFFVINDPICFYKSKPDTVFNINAVNPIQIFRVRFQETLSRERFKRIEKNFFRVHRQIMLANDKRYFYDYFAYISFPLPVRDWFTKEKRTRLSITRDVKTIKELKDEQRQIKGDQ